MSKENIKVIVNGAKGRMGQEAVRAVESQADLTLVGQTDLGDDLAVSIRKTGAKRRGFSVSYFVDDLLLFF